jgi:hypothetical protein
VLADLPDCEWSPNFARLEAFAPSSSDGDAELAYGVGPGECAREHEVVSCGRFYRSVGLAASGTARIK